MNGALSVRSFGDPSAPPLVLLHPIATRGEIWALQAPILARRRHVIVPDLPGHGASPPLPPGAALAGYATAVVDAVAPLAARPFGVVGVSFGGMVAQAIAIAAPERVGALVLAHCGARTLPPVRALWAERRAAAALHGMRAQVDATLGRWFTPAFLADAPATGAWVGDMVARTALDGYAAAIDAICGLDHLDALGRIGVPTLVIAGRADTAVPLAATEAIAAAIPSSRLHVLENAAHLGNVEQAQRFTELLDGFFSAADGVLNDGQPITNGDKS